MSAVTEHARSLDSQAGLAGVVGGAAWVVSPFGTLAFASHAPGRPGIAWLAVALVLPAAFLIAAQVGLWVRHRGAFGLLGHIGTALTTLAVAAIGGGVGTELVTLATVGSLNDIGHAVTLGGFALLLPGTVLLGPAVARARVLPNRRAVASAMALCVPLGVGLGAAATVLGIGGQESDFGFWLALTAPFGVAAVLAGLAGRRASALGRA